MRAKRVFLRVARVGCLRFPRLEPDEEWGIEDTLAYRDVIASPPEIASVTALQERSWTEWPQPYLARLLWEQEWVDRILMYAAYDAYAHAVDQHMLGCPTLYRKSICQCLTMQDIFATHGWLENIVIGDIECNSDALMSPGQGSWYTEYLGRE